MSLALLVARGRMTVAPPSDDWEANLPAWANAGNRILDTRFTPTSEDMDAAESPNAVGLATTTDSINTLAVVNGTDGTGPYGSSVYRTFYEAGDDGNGDGGTTLFGAGGQAWRRIYFCIAVKVDAFYRIHATGGEKFWYPRMTRGGSCMLNWHIQGSQTATGTTWCFYLDPQVGDSRQYQPDNGVYPVKGDWNILQVEMQCDTPGNANGVLRVYVNGDAAINRTDVNYSTNGSQDSFDGIYFNGVRGGPADSANVPSGGQSRYYNRLAFYATTGG